MRRGLVAFALAWAVIGLVIAGHGLRAVNADAVWFVGLASLVFPAAAVAAAFAAQAGRVRLAGALLIVSAGTPTYFAYAVNLVPLVVGIAVIIRTRSPRTVERMLSRT